MDEESPQLPPPRREHVLAWAMDVVACLYGAWMFIVLWRNGGAFGHVYEGLGAELPLATRVVVDHGTWLYPLTFGLFAVVVLGKDLFVQDKRFSVMLTFFLTLLLQVVAHLAVVAQYLPLFHLMRKL
jgi:type II secretory pathway component PulF